MNKFFKILKKKKIKKIKKMLHFFFNKFFKNLKKKCSGPGVPVPGIVRVEAVPLPVPVPAWDDPHLCGEEPPHGR